MGTKTKTPPVIRGILLGAPGGTRTPNLLIRGQWIFSLLINKF